jgi:DNA-binding MarR family transcriptional regulator
VAPRPLSSALPPKGELGAVDGLVQLSFLVQNSLGRHAAEHGLSLVQTRLLGILRDREPTMNELARLLELDKSSVTGLIDRAERRGLVQRSSSPLDRRAVIVRLGDKGRSLVSGVSAGFEADVTKMLDCLPAEDRDALCRLISRMLVTYATKRGVDLFATTT